VITLRPLPATFATTRDGLHALAEHVIAPIRYREEGRIGLRPTPFGFGTDMMPGDRQVKVANGLLIDFRPDVELREDITTLRAAGAFLEEPVGAPTEVYAPATDGDPDRPLQVDVGAATSLGEWFTFGAQVLHEVGQAADPAHAVSVVQLWPEHFDLALDLGPEGRRANVGASPGDADHPEPYLYVGPWGDRPADPVWNEPFGASLSYADLLAGTDPVAWITHALAVAQG